MKYMYLAGTTTKAVATIELKHHARKQTSEIETLFL